MEHVPVMVEEAIEALAVQPKGIYVDATFGRGGHSRAILARLGQEGRLLVIDRDPEAVAAAERLAREDRRVVVAYALFSELREVVYRTGVEEVDGVLFDFGVSSPQLEEAERGMSFLRDGPLDMRMDPSRGEPVAVWLARASARELRRVIRDYGEERFAAAVAKAIVRARGERPVVRTRELAEIVAAAIPHREPGQHPATRTFQALRIWVNNELAEIAAALPAAEGVLRRGGRLVAISFHSLEDRLVKRFLQEACASPPLPAGVGVPEVERPRPRMRWVVRRARPSAEERAVNPRARSAVLRAAERL
ncbi:MAG: 16S rRNA (cytosine(1402)-N(4))-methyltransferase RsmH [Hydrogenophilus sp.]|nr:16S rRNA (cytosine(1402)-N(4))-methyltransferase RsmH [Hydrogenophilus sp.]